MAVLSLATVATVTEGGGTDNAVAPFDIRPFALPNTAPHEVWFEEPRDITRLVVEFNDAVPDKLVVSYQRKVWPETRLEELSKNHPGGFGWVHQDDWFNGHWQRAAVVVTKLDERRAEITFKGIQTELPQADLGDYDVTFRRTYAVKVDAKGNPAIKSVYTTSAPAHTDLRIELDAGIATPGGDALSSEGYNAAVGAVQEVAYESTRCLQLGVDHMAPAHAYSGDDGMVKFTFGGESFTISLVSLEQEGPIWYEDLGVFITKAADPTTFAQYRERIKGLKTISQQVLGHPEQSLAGAHNGQPRPHVDNYNLGCTGAAQRFWLEPNGDVTLHGRNVWWLPSMHPERWKNESREAGRFYFGLETWRITARQPDPEPVMAYNIAARKEGLSVEQQSFAVPLLTPILAGDWQGGDPMVALLRFRFQNDGTAPARAELPIHYTQDGARTGQGGNQDDHRISRGPLDTLTVQGSRILSSFKGKPCVRCAAGHGHGRGAAGRHGAADARTPARRNAARPWSRFPMWCPTGTTELAALDGLSFEACYPQVTEYWRNVAGRGATVQAPEPQLGALHTSHLAHVLMADYKMPDGLVNTSVGTSTYGNFSNESCMIVHELDQRGLHDEARQRLDLWIKYQGTVAQPGNFTDYDGMYYGAGGFECRAPTTSTTAGCCGAWPSTTCSPRDAAWFAKSGRLGHRRGRLGLPPAAEHHDGPAALARLGARLPAGGQPGGRDRLLLLAVHQRADLARRGIRGPGPGGGGPSRGGARARRGRRLRRT